MEKINIRNFLRKLLLAAIELFESPWKAALTSGFVFLAVSFIYGRLGHQSDFAYYNYLADAFLHGKLWLRQLPLSTQDLSLFNGKYYLYWPPFPAIVLIPFIAIFGVQFNDVFITLLLGAVNVGLLAQLLRKACEVDFLRLTKVQRSILVFFFAFGTVHFTLVPFGRVWMTASLVGFTCVLLAYIAAMSINGGKAWLFTGLASSCAMLSRSNLVFTAIFPFTYLLTQKTPKNKKKLYGLILFGLLPFIFMGSVYLLYNKARFGNPFDTGYQYHNMIDFFRPDYEKYGLFNIHFLPINIYYQYLFYPLPLRAESAMGGSLFLLSPIFFGVFTSVRKPRSKILVIALFVSIFLTNIPIILLMGTGFVQFGPRYTLDFTVPLILLTALGIEKWKPLVLLFLSILSGVQYSIGMILMTY